MLRLIKEETLMELFNLKCSIKECQSERKKAFFASIVRVLIIKCCTASEREEKQRRRKFSLVLWISLLILQASHYNNE